MIDRHAWRSGFGAWLVLLCGLGPGAASAQAPSHPSLNAQ